MQQKVLNKKKRQGYFALALISLWLLVYLAVHFNLIKV